MAALIARGSNFCRVLVKSAMPLMPCTEGTVFAPWWNTKMLMANFAGASALGRRAAQTRNKSSSALDQLYYRLAI